MRRVIGLLAVAVLLGAVTVAGQAPAIIAECARPLPPTISRGARSSFPTIAPRRA